MSKLKALEEDGLRSELILKHHLRSLSETLKQQLQETQYRHVEELERRIHQNTLLSTDSSQERSKCDKKQLNRQTKHIGLRRSISTSALTTDKFAEHHRGRAERPDPTSSAKQCEMSPLSKTTQMRKEEEAEAECHRQFCALPVPGHLTQPRFQEMMELREKERKLGHEQRKNFLLSTQKPFSFQEREKEKREKLISLFNNVSQEQENKVRKPSRKVEKDLLQSEQKDQEEMSRTVHTQLTLQQRIFSAPSVPKLRTAERTRKEKLAFLDEKPSFQPKIIQQVPDFRGIHKAQQTEALRKSQTSKDVTKCQPFYLRTAALPERQRRSPQKSQEPKLSNLCRSKSLGALTSLSTDTLPTYITDAVRKRGMAIRKSQELRDSKNQEHAEWMRKYQLRSQAMRKTVTLQAKLLDPHSSLKDVYDEKLKQHTLADQQRMRDYTKELQHMKARISERPFLFQQVKQRNAKALAEQKYVNKLRKAGFEERFFEERGAASEETSTSSVAEDDAEQRHEHDIHSREENVGAEEKIEDVEEESVKSKELL